MRRPERIRRAITTATMAAVVLGFVAEAGARYHAAVATPATGLPQVHLVTARPARSLQHRQAPRPPRRHLHGVALVMAPVASTSGGARHGSDLRPSAVTEPYPVAPRPQRRLATSAGHAIRHAALFHEAHAPPARAS